MDTHGRQRRYESARQLRPLGESGIAYYPGARHSAAGALTEDGNLLLFGGEGYAEDGDSGLLNDVWVLDIGASDD
ncbi:kelch repeat-containing protein [Alkalilimnicola ehrlichii]|uniref:Kelch repeat-containing protein n=1 Tax=Alkalilimnicola ehrlichii TaxID=351052 RepID=UPI002163329D|nr:kelch repeat-containing protein [Alkalilimnicola ehrlichii]